MKQEIGNRSYGKVSEFMSEATSSASVPITSDSFVIPVWLRQSSFDINVKAEMIRKIRGYQSDFNNLSDTVTECVFREDIARD